LDKPCHKITVSRVSDTLGELLAKLSSEDRTLRTFRRALGFSQIIQKDLVPLLIHEKGDVKIIDAGIRLLVNLTIPVECLLPMEIMARTDAGRHTIYELNNLLFSAKDAFIEPRSTRSIIDFMRKMLDQVSTLSSVHSNMLIFLCFHALKHIASAPALYQPY
jgi:timeless